MEASPDLGSKHRPFIASRLLQTQPDAVLCALALRANAGAYEALYNRHHGALYGFVYHLLGRGAAAEDAEDIAQEAFSTAFNRLAERREAGSFKSWLFTIARNRAYDHLRARRPVAADVTELPLTGEAGAESDAERRAGLVWLVGALAELPDRQREALVMRELGGLSYGEIAGDMQTTVAGVKQLINRARAAVIDAAEGDGLRQRRISKELKALVPAAPLAAGGTSLTAFGVGGSTAGVAVGIGGVSAATKIAAAVLAAAAIGGAAAGVNQVVGANGSAAARHGVENSRAARESASSDATTGAASDNNAGGAARSAGRHDSGAGSSHARGHSGGSGGSGGAGGSGGSGGSGGGTVGSPGSGDQSHSHGGSGTGGDGRRQQTSTDGGGGGSDNSNSDSQASPDTQNSTDGQQADNGGGGSDSPSGDPQTNGGDSSLSPPTGGGD